MGESVALWVNESPAAGTNSIVITKGPNPGASDNITFQLDFASSPTASITIQGSNFVPTTAPQNGLVLATVTTINASYTDTNNFAFYWANVTSVSAGEPLTLLAQRS